MQANQSFIKTATSKMKKTINTILSILFPFRELNDRPSVFIQSTWLEKVMTTPQLKDYLWQCK
jgi:hypothetical protein